MDKLEIKFNLKPGTGKYEIKDVHGSDNESYTESAENKQSFKHNNYNSTVTTGDSFSVSDAVEKLGFGKYQLTLSMFTGVAWLADSMEMMTLSILPPALHCHFCITNYQQVVFLGMMLSSPMWGRIGDRQGRRKALWIAAGLLFVFGFISAFSPNYYCLLVLRLFVGIGIGCVPQAITLYSEFLPSSYRARCVGLMKVFWASGTWLEVLLALIIMPPLGWQWLLCISSLPMLIFFFMCFWLPESARYNAVSGKTEKAMETLNKIAVANKKPMLKGKLIEEVSAERGRMTDLIKPGIRLTTFLVWFIWMACGFCKYGVVFLSTEILEQNGVREAQEASKLASNESHEATTSVSPLTSIETEMDEKGFVNGICSRSGRPCQVLTTSDYLDLLIITAAEFPAILVTVLMLDRIGRKNTIALMFLIFAATISAFVFKIEGRILTTVILFIAKGVITAAVQAKWVYTPEVYPTSIRAIGLGTGSAMSRVGCMITPYVAQVLSQSSIPLAVGIYAVVGITAAIMTMLLPIETKGKAMPD